MTHQKVDAATEWDAFLGGTPLGHFQQSGRWAKAKAVEGWQAERVHATTTDGFRGGWQMLWRPTKFGRVGFVNKGPVLEEESPMAVESSLRGIASHARRMGLRAVILQPPDASLITTADLCRQGFSNLPMSGLIDATIVTDVSGSREELQKRINRRVAQEARRALAKGITVREGAREDLPVFFGLMAETCQRQRTQPNPRSVEQLQAIWDAFYPEARLGLATVKNGEAVAGLLMIGFGSRLTFWKKGWSGRNGDAHPNSALNVDALLRANSLGFQEVDFVGCGREFATTVLASRPLTPVQQRSRDVFNLRLGGEPRLLLPGHVLVVNAGLRLVVNASLRVPWIRKLLSSGFGARDRRLTGRPESKPSTRC